VMFLAGMAVGAEGVSHMVAARALAVSAEKAVALHRPAQPAQRPSMRVYRRAPPGYQLALPLFRPTRRSAASWLGSTCIFGLKLLASCLAGVVVAAALWHDHRNVAPSPDSARQEIATPSGAGETTIYRGPPAQGGVDRGWEADSTDAWDRPPPSNYPLRVKTMTFTPPAPDAAGAILPERARSVPVNPGSRVSSRNARSSRVRSWSLPPGSGE
jgi:hypothetical protein